MSTEENVLWRIPEWFKDLPEETLSKLKTYHSELIRFNAKLNLIGRQTEREADEQHFADCIPAAQTVLSRVQDGVVYDFGSGNGLPGVILAIVAEFAAPQLKIVLVDSDERKAEFLKQMIFGLKLSNAQVLNQRVEELKGQVQFAITRGFASISKVALVCKDVVIPGGEIFHMKSSTWVREVGEMPSQLCAFWAPSLLAEYNLPTSQARRAIVSTKKLK